MRAAGGYGHRHLTEVDAAAAAPVLTASEGHCHRWGDEDVLTAVAAADVDEGDVISSPQRVVVAVHIRGVVRHHHRPEAAAGRWRAVTRQTHKMSLCQVLPRQGGLTRCKGYGGDDMF